MSANIGWPDGLSWMMGSNVTIGSMPRLQLVVTADSGNSWEKFWKKSSELGVFSAATEKASISDVAKGA